MGLEPGSAAEGSSGQRGCVHVWPRAGRGTDKLGAGGVLSPRGSLFLPVQQCPPTLGTHWLFVAALWPPTPSVCSFGLLTPKCSTVVSVNPQADVLTFPPGTDEGAAWRGPRRR